MSRQQLFPFLRPSGCDDAWPGAPQDDRDRVVDQFARLCVRAAVGCDVDAVNPAPGHTPGPDDEREEGRHAASRR